MRFLKIQGTVGENMVRIYKEIVAKRQGKKSIKTGF